MHFSCLNRENYLNNPTIFIMQKLPKGIFTNSTSAVLPLARFAQRNGFDSIFDVAAITAIQGYQRYISPHKGFSCAHTKLHGGESCSQYFLRIISQLGLVEAIPLFHQRLADCKAAHTNLRLLSKKRPKIELCDCEPECDLPCGDCD